MTSPENQEVGGANGHLDLAFDFDGADGDEAVCVAAGLPEAEREGLPKLRRLAVGAAAHLSTHMQRWASARHVLLQFLRTTPERSVDAALEQLKETIEWRVECKVDELLVDPVAIKEEIACSRLLLYKTGLDKSGRPLLIQRIGAWCPETVASAAIANKEAIIRGHIVMAEEIRGLAASSWVAQRKQAEVDGVVPEPTPPRAVIVIDMAGLGYLFLKKGPTIFPVVRELFRIDGRYYPETTACIFVVNAPATFTTLWSAISYMLHPTTRAKLRVLGVESSHPELIEFCGADFLPKELGGTIEDAAPYCKDIRFDGGADPVVFGEQEESVGFFGSFGGGLSWWQKEEEQPVKQETAEKRAEA